MSDRCAFFLAAENEPGPRRRAGRRPSRCSPTPTTPARSTTCRAGSGETRRRLRRRSAAAAAGAVAVPAARGRRRAAPSGRRRGAAPRSTAPGSTYVALAMQQWVADAQTQGLTVNYLPTGSPEGLSRFGESAHRLRRHRGRVLARSASAGARRAAATSTCPTSPARSPSCTTSTTRPAARSTTCTCRARRSPGSSWATSRRWADPAITADNRRPRAARRADHRRVPRRASRARPRCSTTSCRTPSPALFADWAGAQRAADRRCASSSSTAPRTSPRRPYALNGSDQIAQYVASVAGHVVDRLRRVRLRQDLRRRRRPGSRTRRASGCCPTPRTSPPRSSRPACGPTSARSSPACTPARTPSAYPISAYSYIVTQCAPAADRPTCKGPYTNPGVAETLAQCGYALHRLRGPGEHGRHRLLAAAAEPLPGDRQLDRPHAAAPPRR